MQYKNLDKLEADLEKTFRYYKYYYPQKRLPYLATIISGFNQSMIIADTLLGIALDKYLGAECEFYKAMALPPPMHRVH